MADSTGRCTRSLHGTSRHWLTSAAVRGFWLPHYADQAEQVIGVEPNQRLVTLAEQRTFDLPGVDVRHGSAEHLPIGDHTAGIVHARFAYFFGQGAEVGLDEGRGSSHREQRSSRSTTLGPEATSPGCFVRRLSATPRSIPMKRKTGGRSEGPAGTRLRAAGEPSRQANSNGFCESNSPQRWSLTSSRITNRPHSSTSSPSTSGVRTTDERWWSGRSPDQNEPAKPGDNVLENLTFRSPEPSHNAHPQKPAAYRPLPPVPDERSRAGRGRENAGPARLRGGLR